MTKKSSTKTIRKLLEEIDAKRSEKMVASVSVNANASQTPYKVIQHSQHSVFGTQSTHSKMSKKVKLHNIETRLFIQIQAHVQVQCESQQGNAND